MIAPPGATELEYLRLHVNLKEIPAEVLASLSVCKVSARVNGLKVAEADLGELPWMCPDSGGITFELHYAIQEGDQITAELLPAETIPAPPGGLKLTMEMSIKGEIEIDTPEDTEKA